MFLTLILAFSIALLIFCYIIGKNNERYWRKKGVTFYSKNKLLGAFWDFFVQGGALFETFNVLYKKYKKEPAVGIGSLNTPALFVIHPKNVQHVLQSDAFYNRGFTVSEEDVLANNLVFLDGPKWKLLRQNMTPLFTATKLKNMYNFMDKVGQDFVVYLKDNPKTWEGGCYNTLVMFCSASVCGAIFGISSESIFDSPFLKLATTANPGTFIHSMKMTMMSLSPTLSKFFGIKLFTNFEKFFIDAMKKVILQREKDGTKGHDFANLCVNIRSNGKMRDPVSGCEIEPTFEVLAAQAMFFLAAGVEPVAIAIFATLTELGRHPEILEKVHKEIDQHFEKHNNVITYDVISEMTYIDQVLTEAMRINPPVATLVRQCVRDIELPVGNIKVDKGTKVFAPIYQIHNDPEYYSNPDVFDPERFAKGCKISDEYYMPFGMGGRMCIGARYSKLQMAATLVHALRHFTVETVQLGPKKYDGHLTNVRRTDVDVVFKPRNIK